MGENFRPPVACARCGCAKPCACTTTSIETPSAKPFANFQYTRCKLYDLSRWRHPTNGLQVAILRRDIICVVCNRNPSTVADHIIPHKGDEKLFWDAKNLRGVCKGCHDHRTLGEVSRGDRPAPPAVGYPRIVTGN